MHAGVQDTGDRALRAHHHHHFVFLPFLLSSFLPSLPPSFHTTIATITTHLFHTHPTHLSSPPPLMIDLQQGEIIKELPFETQKKVLFHIRKSAIAQM